VPVDLFEKASFIYRILLKYDGQKAMSSKLPDGKYIGCQLCQLVTNRALQTSFVSTPAKSICMALQRVAV